MGAYQLATNVNPKIMLREFFKYLNIFYKVIGGYLYLAFGLSAMAVLFESAGILLIIPLVMEYSSPGSGSGSGNFVSVGLDNLFDFLNITKSFTAILVVFGSAFVLKALFIMASYSYNSGLKSKVLRMFKADIYAGCAEADYDYISRRDFGFLSSLINEQVSRAVLCFHLFLILGAQIINALIYTAFLFYVSYTFGILMVVFGLAIIVIFKTLSVYVLSLSRSSTGERLLLEKLIIESLNSFKYLKATNQFSKVGPVVNNAIEKIAGLEFRIGVSSGLTQAIREPIALILLIAIGLIQLHVFDASIESILVSVALFYRAATAAMNIQSFWQSSLEQVGSLEVISDELQGLLDHKESRLGMAIVGFDKGLVFDDVSFYHEGNDSPTLDQVSFDIASLSQVAFVGPSGAGKSTVMDLILMLYAPHSGKIFIDGTDASVIQSQHWRSGIGYVDQDYILFDDTIANNISMFDKSSDRDAGIEAAAEKASILAFIKDLPLGFETVIGEKGAALSGGQRQRLAIARELYRQPRVLILDEATSALDGESEAWIQESIKELKGQVTTIIISHRLSTISHVDKIFLLNNGSIEESGSYAELSAHSEFFKRLFSTQGVS